MACRPGLMILRPERDALTTTGAFVINLRSCFIDRVQEFSTAICILERLAVVVLDLSYSLRRVDHHHTTTKRTPTTDCE